MGRHAAQYLLSAVGCLPPHNSEAQREREMPVFGIVPYRTEARTRSEARTQEAVDFMFLILRTINNVIHTAEWHLVKGLLRPPPITLLEGLGEYRPYAYGNLRAEDRASMHDRFGLDAQLWQWGRDREDNFTWERLWNWGTIQ